MLMVARVGLLMSIDRLAVPRSTKSIVARRSSKLVGLTIDREGAIAPKAAVSRITGRSASQGRGLVRGVHRDRVVAARLALGPATPGPKRVRRRLRCRRPPRPCRRSVALRAFLYPEAQAPTMA